MTNNDNSREKDLEDIFDDVSKRQEPSSEGYETAYATVHDEWMAAVQRRKRAKFQRVGLALAASVMFSTIVVLWPLGSTPGIELRILSGNGLYLDERPINTETVTLDAEQMLVSERASSVMVGNSNLRLAAGTRLKWLDSELVELQAGKLFIDTYELGNMTVRTQFGEVSDIGTQFQVSLQSAAIEVSVRSGAIQLEADGNVHSAKAKPGKSSVITLGQAGMTQVYELTNNDRWDWIHQAHGGYSNNRVGLLLLEIANELGKDIRFASKGVEASVSTMTIEGRLKTSHPKEALDVVVQSSNLVALETETEIVIERR